MSKIYKAVGDDLWKKCDKINAELLTLTYGSFVASLIKENPHDMIFVNKTLDKMGYSMGVRLIEDFFAKSNMSKCNDFRDTMEMLCKVGFKMYVGFGPLIDHWNQDATECSLLLDRSMNWLTDFVEIDLETQHNLDYCQLYCGLIRGALEMVKIPVECEIVQDYLKQNGENLEIRVRSMKKKAESVPLD